MALESLNNQSGNLQTTGATTQAATTTAAPITPGLAEWYQTNLGREADLGGLQYWSKEFGETLDPNEIALLQQSPEYQNRQFLTNLYQTELGRAPDEGGYKYWMDELNKGMSREDIQKSFNIVPEGQVYDFYQQGLGRAPDEGGKQFWMSAIQSGADPNAIAREISESDEGKRQFIKNLYQTELGRAPDEEGFQYWLDELNRGMSREDIQKSFNLNPEGQVYDFFQQGLGRAPDEAGKEFWMSALKSGADPQDVARNIAISPEARGLRAGELSGLFTKDFGEEFTNTLTADEINKFTDLYADITAKQQYTKPVSEAEFDREFYLQNNPDVARAGVDPYQHYLQYGFDEYISGRNLNRLPNAQGPGLMTADQRYQEVLRQAALDPELGAIIKAKDPFLYESLTPLQFQQDKVKNTERIVYGQYGTYNVDGVDVPILNARVADQILGRDGFGFVSDFSHGRGRALSELGWSSNSFSNKIARGAQAIGVTAYDGGDGNIAYQGLDEAAKIVGLDTSKFADKQVQAVSQPGFDENGNYSAGGEPMFETDSFGNQVPVMTTISRDQQLYDAINEAAKDIYLYTGDSLTPGRAREGGGQSFDTVLYKRVGDELIPITAPTAHGGYQNLDVYTGGSGFNFGRDIAPGLIFVGGAALAWTGAGALASQIGNFITAPIGSALGVAVPAGVSSVVGGITIGAATGALTAAATGTDIGQGALKGGVAGGVGAAMPQVLNNLPGMGGVVKGIASSLNLNPADVSSVVSATLSRTLATAAAGANGDQILNAFGTALASTSIGAAGANAVKSVFADSFTPSQLAGMARATQLVTNAAASSLLSGGSAEQVAGSVINSLVSGAGSIQQAADKAAKAGFTKAELDAIQQGADQARSSGQSQYYAIASNITSDQPIPLVSKDSVEQGLYNSKFWDPESKSWKPLPTSETGGGGSGFSQSSVGETPRITEAPSAAQLKQEAEFGQLPSVGEINNMLANGRMSKEAADAYLGALGQYQPATPDFSKIDDSLNLAISLTVNLVGSGANPVKTLNNVSKATGIDTRIISQAINSTKGPTGDTTTTGAAKVTGATDGSGATGATGPTGVTGVTGGGSGVTGATGGGGGGEGAGEGGGGEGTGGTGVTGGTGTGGEGTGTGGGGGGTGTGGGGGGRLPTLPTLPTIPAITAARRVAAEDVDGIYNLTPGLTRARTDYQLAGRFGMANGGTVSQYNPFGLGDYTSADAGVSDITKTPFVGSNLKMPRLTAGLTKRMLDYALPGLLKFEEGGSVPGEHNPQFFSEGGLNSLENRYVNGEGDGTSDSVPAMLATGEFVIPADVVSSLGNGSNDAGAAALDEFLKVVREHKQKHDAKKLPPDSKGPLAYLLEAKKRA